MRGNVMKHSLNHAIYHPYLINIRRKQSLVFNVSLYCYAFSMEVSLAILP